MKISTKVKKINTCITVFLISHGVANASTEVGRIISAACDWLSGEIGAGIAVLAVIYTGFEMISGEIDKKKFAVRCVAIGMIVGGAYITTNILGVGI